MEAIIGLLITIAILTLYVFKKDSKRKAEYEAWKKEHGLSDEDCGI
jgi:hypothetical protein